MNKCIIKLTALLLGITFLFIGKNVYAFDNDVAITINAVNRYTTGTNYQWVETSQPFETNTNLVGWSSMTRTYIYGGYGWPRPGTAYSYVRALGGSFYAPMEASKNYTIEIVTFHGQDFYAGQAGQGKVYNPTCSLVVDSGAVNNVSCTIEQNTYVSNNGVYYDRIRFYFTSSANQYSNVLYTWQIGNTNTTDYIYINLIPSTISEDNYIGWDNIYFGYGNDSSNDGGIGGVISSLDRNNVTQQQTNTILGQIREKLYDFKDSFDTKMNTLISTAQSILQNMGQSISGFVENIKNKVNDIYNFFTNTILGLDDIDDVLQDWVDGFDDNVVMQDIHSFLESPIAMLDYIKNPSINPCFDESFVIFNKTITIPSGCFFWERNDVSTFRDFWNLLFGGYLIIKLGFHYFKILHNAFDPTANDLGGLQV